MQQTVNSVPETYVLDTAGGLTQVLADGTNAYLFGVGRISQQGCQYRKGQLAERLAAAAQRWTTEGKLLHLFTLTVSGLENCLFSTLHTIQKDDSINDHIYSI